MWMFGCVGVARDDEKERVVGEEREARGREAEKPRGREAEKGGGERERGIHVPPSPKFPPLCE